MDIHPKSRHRLSANGMMRHPKNIMAHLEIDMSEKGGLSRLIFPSSIGAPSINGY
ncbi:MAG: hypothetical protein N3F10_07810 [Candidatus Bathyarchaeota archaeon]|nr:hypothetical protein [Candidatus Bathyarchaeota archaeon]